MAASLEFIQHCSVLQKYHSLLHHFPAKSFLTSSPLALQPLDFEKKASYTLKVEGTNIHVDPAVSRQHGSFQDVTIVHVSVEDVDEPPLFDLPAYYVELSEDAEVGTLVKMVSARDPDAANNTVR